MKSKKESLQEVILSKNINFYRILDRGNHTGLYNSHNKWITWLTQKEIRELIDLGVQRR